MKISFFIISSFGVCIKVPYFLDAVKIQTSHKKTSTGNNQKNIKSLYKKYIT